MGYVRAENISKNAQDKYCRRVRKLIWRGIQGGGPRPAKLPQGGLARLQTNPFHIRNSGARI